MLFSLTLLELDSKYSAVVTPLLEGVSFMEDILTEFDLDSAEGLEELD
jgi:hypothetical protein